MKLACLVAVGLLLLAPAAHAGVGSGALADIEVAPPPGAAMPTGAVWEDEGGRRVTLAEAMAGRPTLVIFADFTCRTLCGPIVSTVAGELSQAALDPGRDYRVLVLGLDARDGAGDAADMREQQVGESRAAPAFMFLRAGEAEVKRAASAVGYRFVYDAGHDQFAHPAAILVLAADGRVTRVLSGVGISPGDLTLALVEAGQGRVGSVGQRARLLCYGFDPAAGVYTLSIHRIVALAWSLGAVVLGAGIAVLALRASRRAG